MARNLIRQNKIQRVKPHHCRTPFFLFRGPENGTEWRCPKCQRLWVWHSYFPGSLSTSSRGPHSPTCSTWWNIEHEKAFQNMDFSKGLIPDADEHGGYGGSALPLFGSRGDGKREPDLTSRPWFAVGWKESQRVRQA